jgi:hypothetical protein
VKAVEMKVVHRRREGKNPRNDHFCEVGVRVLDPASGSVIYAALVETERFHDDPDTPYKAALPLATDLASSLGVARRITDAS